MKSDPYFHSLKGQRLRKGREMERKQGYYDTVTVRYNDSTFLEGNLVICDVKPIAATMTTSRKLSPGNDGIIY